ncbi:MAG: mechanosensitive ion channel, partial [Deltaproteobacteria bacterium]|nr:mechanosensitive ion channel [Deltaproteobacteria bacterium]
MSVFVFARVWRCIGIFALLLTAAFAGPGRAAAVEHGVFGVNMEKTLAAQTRELAKLIKAMDELAVEVEDTAGVVMRELRESQRRFARLAPLLESGRERPADMPILIRQMRLLLGGFTHEVQEPVRELDAGLRSAQEALDWHRERLRELSLEKAASLNLEGAEDRHLAAFSRVLEQAGHRADALAARLREIEAPAREHEESIRKAMEAEKTGLRESWTRYYTERTEELPGPARIAPLARGWLNSLRLRLLFAYPQQDEEWVRCGVRGGLALLALIPALFWGLSRMGRTRGGTPRVPLPACCLIIPGLALLAASSGEDSGYMIFDLPGTLLLIYGAAELGLGLHTPTRRDFETPCPAPDDGRPSRAATPPEQAQSGITPEQATAKGASALKHLYPTAAAGLLLVFADAPAPLLRLCWAAIMLVFSIRRVFFSRRTRVEAKNTWPEKAARACAPIFGLLALLITLAGYPRLGVSAFMTLFALANMFFLGAALSRLLLRGAERLCPPNDMPLRNALAQSLAIPLAWGISPLCALPWLWAVPGLAYTLEDVLYLAHNVGGVSFNFFKLLLIAPLFFLFRALAGLGRTSLEHLPEKIPGLERGVIPPLRNILTYGVWLLFGLIIMGFLGLNLTSLAVVAGGLSVGIGFGLQNIFNNLISGLMLIFGRSILVGDYVEVGGVSGTVRAINIRSTTVETPERALVYVPNSAIMSGQFTNWTRGSRQVRRSLKLGAAYGTDTAKVMRLMLEAAGQHPKILQHPAPTVYLSNFGDNAL